MMQLSHRRKFRRLDNYFIEHEMLVRFIVLMMANAMRSVV